MGGNKEEGNENIEFAQNFPQASRRKVTLFLSLSLSFHAPQSLSGLDSFFLPVFMAAARFLLGLNFGPHQEARGSNPPHFRGSDTVPHVPLCSTFTLH